MEPSRPRASKVHMNPKKQRQRWDRHVGPKRHDRRTHVNHARGPTNRYLRIERLSTRTPIESAQCCRTVYIAQGPKTHTLQRTLLESLNLATCSSRGCGRRSFFCSSEPVALLSTSSTSGAVKRPDLNLTRAQSLIACLSGVGVLIIPRRWRTPPGKLGGYAYCCFC